jgi:hypothetical protein
MSWDNGRFHVIWSDEDGEYIATCEGYPSMSYLALTPVEALGGIKRLVCDIELGET